jgi:hypothetical protein
MKRALTFPILILFFVFNVYSQSEFDGLDMNMGNLYRLSDAKTRSISPENFTGEKGKGGMATLSIGMTRQARRWNALSGTFLPTDGENTPM